MKNTSLAIINRSSPYVSQAGKDSIDLALVAGTFEQDVALFFQGDGVFQLLKRQQAPLAGQKDYSKTFAALEFYDVEKLYVCLRSLNQRQLSQEQLLVQCETLDSEQWQTQLKLYDHVLVF